MASTPEQQQALRERARDALVRSGSDGEALARAAREATPRINVSVPFATEFLRSERSLYRTFGRAAAADAPSQQSAPRAGKGARTGERGDDGLRRMVDGRLFGRCADEIRYAALGLGELGLTAYGPVTLELRPEAVAHRASVLEEDTFGFFARHGLGHLEPAGRGYRARPEPLGYRAAWLDRHLLVLAKLAPRLPVPPADLPRLLLRPAADRCSDELLEVHIYGPLDRSAVRRVLLPRERPPQVDAREWRLLHLTLRALSLAWVEVDDASETDTAADTDTATDGPAAP
jgi:hypothetical protein